MKSVKLILFLFSFVISYNITAQNVYTTKTGEKYHKETCHYLKYSRKEYTLKRALELGFTACAVCKPNKNTSVSNSSRITSTSRLSHSRQSATSKVTATQCTGKTKSGARCKRKVKNASGRCYQHTL